MERTLIYLKDICDQLREAISLPDGFNVAALIDEKDPHLVQGWCVVRINPDGSTQPADDVRYKTIDELMRRDGNKMTPHDIAEAEALSNHYASKATPRRRKKNARTQFEIISIFKRILDKEYKWCVKNLPLKDESGLVYNATEIYVITSSQKILDKLNKHFGSAFDISDMQGSRVFYIR